MLKGLTKGAGGTIQAMRFLDTALTDTKNQYHVLTDSMNGAEGAMAAAYKTMSNTPQAKIDLLSNRFDVLKVTIGEKLLPNIAKLAAIGTKIIDWFEGLSPKLQDNIIKWSAIGSVVLVVTGVVLALGGILLMFAGTIMTAFGVGIVGALGIMALIPIAIAAIGVAIFLLIKNFDAVKPVLAFVKEKFLELYDTIKNFISSIDFAGYWASFKLGLEIAGQALSEFAVKAVEFLLPIATTLYDVGMSILSTVTTIFGAIASVIITIWNAIDEQVMHIVTGIRDGAIQAWQTIKDQVGPIVKALADLVMAVWEEVREFWDKNGKAIIKQVTDTWKTLVNAVQPILGPLVEAVGHILNAILIIFEEVFSVIAKIVGIAFVVITEVMRAGLEVAKLLWEAGGQDLLRIIKNIWTMIFEVIRAAITFVSEIIQAVLAIINGDFMKFYDHMNAAARAAWDAFFGLIRGALTTIIDFVNGFMKIMFEVLGFRQFFDMGKNIVQGIIDGIGSMIGKLTAKVGDMVKGITQPLSFFKFGSPSKTMMKYGNWIGEGMADGIDARAKLVADAAAYLARSAVPPVGIGSGVGGGAASAGVAGLGAGLASTGGNITLSLATGAIQISGVSDPEQAASLVDEKLRMLVNELRSR